MAAFGVGSCLLGICPSYQKVLRKFSLEIGVPPPPLVTLCWHCHLVITSASQSFQSLCTWWTKCCINGEGYLEQRRNPVILFNLSFKSISCIFSTGHKRSALLALFSRNWLLACLVSTSLSSSPISSLQCMNLFWGWEGHWGFACPLF